MYKKQRHHFDDIGLYTQIDGVKMEIATDYFLELQNHCGW